MAVDVRYVGTRGVDQWSTLNYNTRDIETNGFIDEFKLAVANLKANNASGGADAPAASRTSVRARARTRCRSTLAYLIGPSGNAGTFRRYTGTIWTSTAITQDMVFLNPSPTNAAADLDGDATRRANAVDGGLPGELLRAESDGETVQRHRQRRVPRLPRAADRPAASALAGPLGQRQLPVRDGRGLGVRRLPLRPDDGAVRATCGMRSRRSGTGRFPSAAVSAT